MDCHDLETRLKEFNQEHLLRFYNTLDDDQQIKLSNELKSVDFKKIARLYSIAKEDLEKPQVRPFSASISIGVVIMCWWFCYTFLFLRNSKRSLHQDYSHGKKHY